MTKQPFVSIILPTYNVEKYLLHCLDSIRNQSYQNYEVIIVIDGASDKSYEIAKDYCAHNNKFSVYWQENSGSGPARNKGLDYANGEYVCFIDPDDWIEPEYIERLVVAQQKCNFDLVTTYANFVYYDKNDKIIGSKQRKATALELLDKNSVRTYYIDLFNKNMISAPTRMLYRMSIIRENSILFPDLRRSQDIVFNYRYYNYINKLCVSTFSGYNYRVLLSDRMCRIKSDYYKTIELLYRDIKKMHSDWGIPLDMGILANAFFVYVYSTIEAMMLRKESISNLLHNTTIQEIILNAHPEQMNKKIAHWLLNNKHNWSLKIYIRIVYMLKLKYV